MMSSDTWRRVAQALFLRKLLAKQKIVVLLILRNVGVSANGTIVRGKCFLSEETYQLSFGSLMLDPQGTSRVTLSAEQTFLL